MRHDAEQEAAEKAFFAFIDGLNESTKAPRRFREILEAAEDSGDYETGLERLKRYVTERETSLLRVDVPTVQEGVEVRPEDVVTMTQEIRNRMNTKRFFLGSGNTASVHTLKTPGATNGWVCAKIITNRQRYKEGRPSWKRWVFSIGFPILKLKVCELRCRFSPSRPRAWKAWSWNIWTPAPLNTS